MMTSRRAITIVLACAFLLLVGIVGLLSRRGPQAFHRNPDGIMGTECELTAVTTGIMRGDRSVRALGRAEEALRDVEIRMSRHLAESELARFNEAGRGERVELSAQTLEVLRLSRDLAGQTGGAFDVTCRPLIQVWARAGKARRLPTEAELAEAKRLTGWEHIELLENAARKRIDGAAVDLGGIAKGYAIDRAVEAMADAGAIGGLVNVGGDVRAFGLRPEGEPWRIGVRNPFDASLLVTLEITDLAVCTSGNYERYFEIDEKRYSHIVDPRTGFAAEMTPSVTVVAPTAAVADAWATALSVLGVEGIERIPRDLAIEAMIVVGTAQAYEVHITAGFEGLFAERPGAQIRVHRFDAATSGPSAGSAVDGGQ